jgi:putative phosphoesterase
VNGASIVGLISDTHGLLRTEALASLQGSDLIIHAGDIGNAEILNQLRAIAPVVAVRGNIDKASWASQLEMTAVIEAGPAVIYVLHDIHDLDLDPAVADFDIVVSGHSHKPSRSVRSGVLYVNPGSAGPRRFRLPVTIARLDLSQEPWTVDFVNLLSLDAASQ